MRFDDNPRAFGAVLLGLAGLGGALYLVLRKKPVAPAASRAAGTPSSDAVASPSGRALLTPMVAVGPEATPAQPTAPQQLPGVPLDQVSGELAQWGAHDFDVDIASKSQAKSGITMVSDLQRIPAGWKSDGTNAAVGPCTTTNGSTTCPYYQYTGVDVARAALRAGMYFMYRPEDTGGTLRVEARDVPLTTWEGNTPENVAKYGYFNPLQENYKMWLQQGYTVVRP